ncbi:sigma-70 family RNA polymerase sigma factor [Yeosuana marina]|uniref:RNA polymerase sigma factor n=1 Tax=Yeosuana marina TaxID=1565536 RepID=UPI0030EC48F0|tara:strand:+ start:4233 stop:4787 length:555 start_codon:yes stop_codon:yes gene_type:complete
MEQHFVDALKTDNHLVIKELYNNNREAFLKFSKQYNIEYMDCVDIYQEAFILLRKQAISGKLFDVKSGLKTYLFGIAKHLIYKKFKENASKQRYNPILHNKYNDYEEIEVEQETELTTEQQLINLHFKQLGKSCQEMLTLSFYRGLSNNEIANLKGYENESVVRSQKSRCLKTLKDLIVKYPKK